MRPSESLLIMKTLIALLASTTLAYAASVGVSNEQLKASGQYTERSIPESTTEQLGEDLSKLHQEVVQWTLTGLLKYDDGTPEGVDISLPLAVYPSKAECEAVASDEGNVKAALKHNGMKLDCRQ